MYCKIKKMNILSTSSVTLFLIIYVTRHTCHGIEPFFVVTSTLSALSSISSLAQRLWQLNHEDDVTTAMQNYKIHTEILSANKDVIRILSDIPEKQEFIKKLENFEESISTIEKNYKDMANYHKNHQHISSYLKDKMITMSSNMLLYSYDAGPVKLMHDVMDVFALAGSNILDQLKGKSNVSTDKKIKKKINSFSV